MTAAKTAQDLLKCKWTPEEDSILADLWPRNILPEIERALPTRTLSSIRRRAHELKIKCEHRKHLAKVVSPIFVRDGVEGKACVKCLDWKPLENFARHATCSGGRRNSCVTCEGRTRGKKYYNANREKCIARKRDYQRRNPEKVRAWEMNARARRYDRGWEHRGHHGVTVEELRGIREVFGDLCVYCGEQATTLDHVIPLARGGPHEVSNLVPACSDCNLRKHNKTPEEWAAHKLENDR
jgi:5-methylcytosine-specific restriction endonuclease McrA